MNLNKHLVLIDYERRAIKSTNHQTMPLRVSGNMDFFCTQMPFVGKLKRKMASSSRDHSSLKHALSRTGSIMKPFLKWPGGKRWFVEKHFDFLPQELQGRYIEPFVGSGAVFFALLPERAVLSDISDDLISTYRGIQNHHSKVQALLVQYSKKHSVAHYYRVRDTEPSSIAERAARFLYLNRTCFNGIYRVNTQGRFNVPVGSRNNVLQRDDDFLGWSRALSHVHMQTSDFEPIINNATKGDFIFVDPPYTVCHNNNGFVKYNDVLFSWKDQIRLRDCLVRARTRGVQILMANANHGSIRDLYGSDFKQSVVSRFCSIAASGTKRDRFQELIIQS